MASTHADDGGGASATFAGIDVQRLERLAVPVLGSVMIAGGLRRESVGGAVLAVAGGGLVLTSVVAKRFRSGDQQQHADPNDAPNETPTADIPELSRTLTIGKPADELYRLWRDPGTLPRIMHGVADVETDGPDRANWTFHGPLGRSFEWQTRVVEDRPGQAIRWESVEGAKIANEGSVEFRPAPLDWGTEVTLRIRFDPPGGVIGDAAMKLAGPAPNLMVGKVLRRFKNLAETGEIPTTEPQPAARDDKG